MSTSIVFEWTRITLEKWGVVGMDALRPMQSWHALDLYHRLDPDAIGMTGALGNFYQLSDRVKGDADHVVMRLAQQSISCESISRPAGSKSTKLSRRGWSGVSLVAPPSGSTSRGVH